MQEENCFRVSCLSFQCGSNRLERTDECEEHMRRFFLFLLFILFVWFRWRLQSSEQCSCGVDGHSLLSVEEDRGRVHVFLRLEWSGGLEGLGSINEKELRSWRGCERYA